MKTLFIAFASISLAQEISKETPKDPFSETLKLEYYQATNASKSAKANYEIMMANIKEAILKATEQHTQAVIRVLIANSKLQEVCKDIGKELDQKALQEDEIRCVDNIKESSK